MAAAAGAGGVDFRRPLAVEHGGAGVAAGRGAVEPEQETEVSRDVGRRLAVGCGGVDPLVARLAPVQVCSSRHVDHKTPMHIFIFIFLLLLLLLLWIYIYMYVIKE